MENQGLTEIKVNHIYCTFLTHWAICVIAEGKLVSQLKLAPGKSTLAVPDAFLSFTDVNTTPRRMCFASPPRDQGEASQPVIPPSPPALNLS